MSGLSQNASFTETQQHQQRKIIEPFSAMDWFSWLSKTTLDPSLVYEYGLALSHNELEQDDIVYFNHEFLQSIGISIAKHRLEILKLARKDGALHHPRPITRLLLAIKRTKRCFAKLIRNFTVHSGEDSKALVVVPKSTYAGKSLKRNKKLMVAKQQGRFLLTNGSPAAGLWPRIESFSGPIVYDLRRDEKKEDEEDGYWGGGVEEIRWDTMFQNLKPT